MNIFKVDDVAFHYKHGAGRVAEVYSNESYRFEWASKKGPVIKYTICDDNELSFEPWSKPVHVMPIKVGWWVYLTENSNRLVVWVEKGGMSSGPNMTGVSYKSEWLIKFLSDDPSYFAKN